MIRASTVTLVTPKTPGHGVYDAPELNERTVYCDVESVSRREMYEAMNHGMKPSWVLVLSDYAEYQDEETCIFEGKTYRILRTYVRQDHAIELTIERMTQYDIQHT